MHGITVVNLSDGCCFLNPVNTSFARAESHLPHTGTSFSISSEYIFPFVTDTISWNNNIPLARRFQYARSAVFCIP